MFRGSALVCLAWALLSAGASTAQADPGAGNGARRAFLGVGTEAVPGGRGLRVTEVLAGSPAATAGLVSGDIITRIGRFPARAPNELVQVVSVATPGQSLELRVRRTSGAEQTVRARLGDPPREARGRIGRLVGQSSPTVSATRLAGPDPVRLDALRGRVVLLDFWATWCGPCRATMPLLDAMHQSRHAAGLTVLGLSSERTERIRAHLSRSPVGYTIAADGGTAERFGVDALPTLVVIDRAGHVRDVMVGVDGSSFRRLDALVQRLLAEPAP